MQKHRLTRQWTALASSLLMLLTMLTPFSVLAADNADGYDEVLRFSKFEKTYTSTKERSNIYADWTLGDNVPTDITDGHKLENLRLQLKFTLQKPDSVTDTALTWNKDGYIKVRSVENNGENNYGWWIRSKSNSPIRLHTGENELLIPLVNMTGDGYDVTTTGKIDWTQVDRLLMVVAGKGMGDDDHQMTVTYAGIVDVGEQATVESDIEMPTLFADRMMFQQNKPMKVWGTATAGETIEVAFSQQGETDPLQTKTATVGADGSWSVELAAMPASYQQYTMTVTAKQGDKQVEKKTISDILIGEVWVTAGQSNMQLPVSDDLYADEIAAAANNENIRMFLEPTYPFGEKGAQPRDPQDTVPNAYWATGKDDGDVLAVSAVGYHFAVAMQQKLNVPFGILYTPVGGSVIEAWIAKDAIDADETYKNFLKSKNKYCDENNWPEFANRMSTLYNQKISAFKGYNVAGTIWYQGESNESEADMYAHALTLLRDNWNDVFGYGGDKGDMPFVFTNVAAWITHLEDPQFLAYLHEGMADGFRQNEDRNMAMITIYDLPLYFLNKKGNSSDPIHPRVKEPVGQRFATAAYNMVYDTTGAEYTAPVYKSHTPVDTDGDGINDAIEVTFDHVGEGLQVINAAYAGDGHFNNSDGLGVVSETEDVHGFAIAGTGGVYVNAKAKITGKNTVQVWSDGLKNPTNVTYNFYTYGTGGTLKNSVGIPAAPFRSDRSATAAYFNAQDWTYADANVWTCFPNGTLNWADFLDSWVSGAISGAAADWSYDKDTKVEGRASVKVAYTPDASKTVGIGPVMGRLNVTNQFDNFDTIAVSVKNGNARQKQLSLLLQSNGKVYKAAVAENFKATQATTASVAASSDFTTYTFSLRNLVDESGALLTDTDAILQHIDQLQFTFTDDKAGVVYVDDVRFGFLYDENVDKSALTRELNWSVDTTLYTEASLAAYDAAKENAQAVFDDPVATQSQVNRMAQTLKETRLALMENNAVATFSAFEQTVVSGAVGNSLYANWSQSDVAPLDLTQYGLENLRLQIKFTLTKPDDVEDTVALFNNYGFIKLRSVDTPAENNYGWLFSTSNSNAIRLHTGDNELSIPLVNKDGDGYTITRTGAMDWTQVNQIMMMIGNDIMKGRDGEFSLTITDVKIVDMRVNNAQKEALKTVMDQTVDTTGDAGKVAAYTRAKANAQAVYEDEMASLTEMAQATKTLQTAIAVLGGAAFTPADKDALQALVDGAAEKDMELYTPESVYTYQHALANAKAVLANDYASQADVDDAVDTLQKAESGLLAKPPVDTTELEALTTETLDLTPYTDASVKTYQAAVAAGKEVLKSDKLSQTQVNNAVKAIKEAKDALKEKLTGDPTDITVTFSQSNGTYQSLLYGTQFYTNWKVGDGLTGSGAIGGGANLSGTAANGANRNLALQATVTFNALQDGVDFATCWKQMGFRLRSSAIGGGNKEAEFYTIQPSKVTIQDGSFQVMIPLSDIQTANMDWADVKELNIFCEVADAYKKGNNENCDAFTVTLSDVKIASTGTVVEPDKTALTKAIADAEAKLKDGKGYTANTRAALSTALDEAQALLTSTDQTAITAAVKKLDDAIQNLRQYGDVDGKDGVTATDALLALKAATNAITLNSDQLSAADVDGQAGVSVVDALMILQAAAGKITLA